MLLLLVICATSLFLAQAETDKKVVCYWGAWSKNREGDGHFDVSDIDPKLCTHLIFTFIGLTDASGDEVVSLDSKVDSEIAPFNKLREKNPGLKTMVAMGGWSQGSARFSKASAEPSRRRKLVESAIAFVKKYGFDGLDVDWEYPVRPEIGGAPADKENYVLLLKELRELCDKEGLLLSAAVAAPEGLASQSYNIPEISKYLDFINIMAYDLHGTWEPQTGLHSALRSASSDDKLNIESIVKYWISAGAPAEKLVLGIPLYGKSWTLSDPKSNGIGAPASPGAPGPYIKDAGSLGYNEICEKIKNDNWQENYNAELKTVYAVGGNQWVSYDNEKVIKEKADLIKKHNLGGGMVWSIEMDDFHGKCGEKFPLLQTLNSELRNGASPAASDSRPKGTAQKSQPEKPSRQSRQNQSNNSQQDKPSKPQPQNPKQPANNGEICQSKNPVKDPSDCSKYYVCESVNNKFISYSMNCGPGTRFDPVGNVCDHDYLVKC